MRLAPLVLLLAITPARGDAVTTEQGGATIDWSRGLVIVEAIGTADRHAPSPAVARVSSLNEAEARAQTALIAAARALPVASGGTIGDALDADAAAAALSGITIDLATKRLPDGSVRVTRGLPIEAVRGAVAGPRAITPDWSGAAPAGDAPTALIVDARNLKVTPGVGIAVSDGQATMTPPAVYVAKAPDDDDPRLGARVVRVEAEQLEAGALIVPAGTRLEPGALLVVVVGVEE